MERFVARSTGDAEIDAVFQDVAKALNELISMVRASAPEGQEAEGTIRIIKVSSNVYRIALRTSDGWVVSDDTTFTFQDKLT